MEYLKENVSALLICDNTNNLFTEIKNTNFNVHTTNADHMITGEQAEYETIILNQIEKLNEHKSSLLTRVLKSLKPGGTFVIIGSTNKQIEHIDFLLKTNGFINVNIGKDIVCNKPNYEIGSIKKLNLKPKITGNVWKLDDTADEEVEMIDPDNLLDEDDFKKPDPVSLKVCGTTGKRKACKDCSCGLAQELATEGGLKNNSTEKSSCGSCYLGDAFRCATCPYLGMPAFKPGEKILLTDDQLKADV